MVVSFLRRLRSCRGNFHFHRLIFSPRLCDDDIFLRRTCVLMLIGAREWDCFVARIINCFMCTLSCYRYDCNLPPHCLEPGRGCSIKAGKQAAAYNRNTMGARCFLNKLEYWIKAVGIQTTAYLLKSFLLKRTNIEVCHCV